MKIFRIHHPITGGQISHLWYRSEEEAGREAKRLQEEMNLPTKPRVTMSSGVIMLHDPLHERIVWLKGGRLVAAPEVPGLQAFDPGSCEEVPKGADGRWPPEWQLFYDTLKRWEEVGGHS